MQKPEEPQERRWAAGLGLLCTCVAFVLCICSIFASILVAIGGAVADVDHADVDHTYTCMFALGALLFAVNMYLIYSGEPEILTNGLLVLGLVVLVFTAWAKYGGLANDIAEVEIVAPGSGKQFGPFRHGQSITNAEELKDAFTEVYGYQGRDGPKQPLCETVSLSIQAKLKDLDSDDSEELEKVSKVFSDKLKMQAPGRELRLLQCSIRMDITPDHSDGVAFVLVMPGSGKSSRSNVIDLGHDEMEILFKHVYIMHSRF